MKTIQSIHLLVWLLLLSFGSVTAQQTDFFKSQTQLISSQARQKVQSMMSGKGYESITPVVLESLPRVLQANDGLFKITIPTTGKTYYAETQDIKTDLNGDYEWTGTFRKVDGSAIVLSKDGETYGYFKIDGREYDLQSFGVGQNVWIAKTPIKDGTKVCGVEEHEGDVKAVTSEETAGEYALTCGDTEVSVLVLFTPRAANRLANPTQSAQLAIAHMNNVLRNSQANGVRVELAAVRELNFTESSRGDLDADALVLNAQARAFRDQFQADLVIMYTDGAYGSLLGIVANIGPDNVQAYGLVQAERASGNVFTHETGHLFGARHEQAADPTGAIQHGYFFRTGWFVFKHDRQTVMYSSYNSSKDIDNFSNPNVSYKGERTGTANNDNARQLRQTAGALRGFRTTVRGPQADITGPTYGENNINYTWRADFCRGTGVGSPSYRWETSLNGFNYYGAPNNTGSSFSRQLPNFADLWLRLTVSFSNGVSAVTTKRIFNTTFNPDNPCEPFLVDEVNRLNIPIDPCLQEFASVAYPNPTDDELTIEYLVKNSGIVEINMTNIGSRENLGKTNNLVRKNQQKGAYREVLPLNDLDPGTYQLTIKVNDQTFTQRIIITNNKHED